MTDEEKKRLKDKLLELGGFTPAPGCLKGCHWLSPSGKVLTTRKALHLAVGKLLE